MTPRAFHFANLVKILCISIYVESDGINKVPFSRRATIYPGTADVDKILQDEVAGKYIKRLQTAPEERGKILVLGKTTAFLWQGRY